MVAPKADAAAGGGAGPSTAKGKKKVQFGGAADMDVDAEVTALTADPAKLTAPIKSVQVRLF